MNSITLLVGFYSIIFTRLNPCKYLVRCEGDFSGAELGERSYKISSHVHSHDPLLVRVLSNDGMANETLDHGRRPEREDRAATDLIDTVKRQ